jgi:hypothetical protein
MNTWEYLIVPLEEVKKLKKDAAPLPPSCLNRLGAEGWEAVGLSLKYATWLPGRLSCSSGHWRKLRSDELRRESMPRRLTDSLLFAGAAVAGPLSRRSVRPLGNEAHRPLPGDDLLPAANEPRTRRYRWQRETAVQSAPRSER